MTGREDSEQKWWWRRICNKSYLWRHASEIQFSRSCEEQWEARTMKTEQWVKGIIVVAVSRVEWERDDLIEKQRGRDKIIDNWCFGLEGLNGGHISFLPSSMGSVWILCAYFATVKQQNPARLDQLCRCQNGFMVTNVWCTFNLQRLNTKIMWMHYWWMTLFSSATVFACIQKQSHCTFP